jgi:hypothetical protein
MPIELPTPISRYFIADQDRDAEAVARCFTDSAIVKDERHRYEGIAAIRQWKADASTKYSYTAEPFSMTTDGDRIVVTSHLEGDFPGSPVDLRYFFRLEGDKVAELEIIL